MGIKGLWKELGPITVPSHISNFKGQRVAIDGYCWLHKAAIASCIPLCTGQPCDRFIQYFMNRAEMLIKFGVVPVFIFDGKSMPMKAGTDAARRERRDAARKEGLVLLEAGRREEAQGVLEKSIDISLEVAYAVVVALRRRGVECIIAPYEADAQLAFLCREGHVQAVVTEDSDLLVYQSAVVIAKLNPQGYCDVVRFREIAHIPALAQLNEESFIMTCILSGCDYLPSLPGVGIKKATKVASQNKSIEEIIAAFRGLGFNQRELQPYEEGIHKALYCFKHHLVFDPTQRKVVTFCPLPETLPLHESLVGQIPPPHLAVKVCADITHDPQTGQPYTYAHEESVKLYLKRANGGQRTLAESGMNVTLLPRKKATVPASLAVPTRRVDPVTGWRRKPGSAVEEADHEEEESSFVTQTQTVTVVRSKYFFNKDDDDDAIDGVNNNTTVVTDATAVCDELDCLAQAAGEEEVEVEDGSSPIGEVEDPTEDRSGDCSPVDDNAPVLVAALDVDAPSLPSSSAQNVLTSSTTAADTSAPLSLATVRPDDETTSSQRQQPSSQSLRDIKCPHGYKECGRVHSIFMKCFAGNPHWTKEPLTPVGSTAPTAPTHRKRLREDHPATAVVATSSHFSSNSNSQQPKALHVVDENSQERTKKKPSTAPPTRGIAGNSVEPQQQQVAVDDDDAELDELFRDKKKKPKVVAGLPTAQRHLEMLKYSAGNRKQQEESPLVATASSSGQAELSTSVGDTPAANGTSTSGRRLVAGMSTQLPRMGLRAPRSSGENPFASFAAKGAK